MKLGNDIIEIERIRQAIERSSSFVERVYTPHEIDYCESRNRSQVFMPQKRRLLKR